MSHKHKFGRLACKLSIVFQFRFQSYQYPHLLRVLFLLGMAFATPAHAMESALELRAVYAETVDRKLTLPADEQHYYAELLFFELAKANLRQLHSQYVLLVDRNPHIQAAMLFWLVDERHAELIGASPVSTGKDNGYEYFETPLGIFDHNPSNLDFRAEGTKNIKGIMGYGNKGMRVFDFGWVSARKTWIPEMGTMRLQLHATDLRLEHRLGSAQSMGCIRIPATLNKLLDHYGVLDADYESAIHNKKILQILDPVRELTPWSGRYMIIVDSRRGSRPDWSALPAEPKRTPKKYPPKPTGSIKLPDLVVIPSHLKWFPPY
jgi:hypothetical protein